MVGNDLLLIGPDKLAVAHSCGASAADAVHVASEWIDCHLFVLPELHHFVNLCGLRRSDEVVLIVWPQVYSGT